MIQPFLKKRKAIEHSRRFFSTPEGKDLLEYWAKDAFLFKSTYVVGDRDQTLLNEGSRRFLLAILKDLSIDVEQLQKMAKNAHNEKSYTT